MLTRKSFLAGLVAVPFTGKLTPQKPSGTKQIILTDSNIMDILHPNLESIEFTYPTREGLKTYLVKVCQKDLRTFNNHNPFASHLISFNADRLDIEISCYPARNLADTPSPARIFVKIESYNLDYNFNDDFHVGFLTMNNSSGQLTITLNIKE